MICKCNDLQMTMQWNFNSGVFNTYFNLQCCMLNHATVHVSYTTLYRFFKQ